MLDLESTAETSIRKQKLSSISERITMIPTYLTMILVVVMA